MFYSGLNSEFLIARIDYQNNLIFLCDGSKWQARRMDTKTLALWSPGQLVQVTSSEVDKYPFELINKDIFGSPNIRVRLLEVFLPGDEEWLRESAQDLRLID